MANQVRIRGADELARKLRAHGVDVQQGLEKITLAAAEVIRSDAESRAGGEFEIVKETAENRQHRVRVAIGPSKKEWYARFREFGASAHEIRARGKQLLIAGDSPRRRARHPGVNARPFLRPAADEKQDEVLAAGKAELKRVTGL